MSAAIRAKSAKARATIAIALIKAGRTDSRGFSDCFKMRDGDDVIREIVRRAVDDPKIREWIFEWTIITPSGRRVRIAK